MTGDAEGLIASLASSYGKGENSVQPNPGLAGHFPLGAVTVSRNGYGAMQLSGDGVYGPPRYRNEAVAVLRAATEYGVYHIDTAQYYGSGVVNDTRR